MTERTDNFDRDAGVLRAVLRGANYETAGAGINRSPQRVSTICEKMLRIMVSPLHLDERLPAGNDLSLASMRKHAAFWERRLDKLVAEKVPPA